ncbi:hypothetical protein LCGC14_1317770 [marine sediment metagenome]|uniref:Uncharacterized protein n=1 Tax=marine sediment metagenome TaxID=412755 RepID=A0A0F9KKX5_9ZZZZ
MTESIKTNICGSSRLHSIVKGYFVVEQSRAVLIRLPIGSSVWVPKKRIYSEYLKDPYALQDFFIENYILKKIGLKINDSD